MVSASYVFGFIVAVCSYVIYQKYVNVYTSIVLKPLKQYDYVIVGAGTAGCVLAARLSEDPKTSVLLIEAGDHMGYFTKIPLTPTAAQLGPSDWAVQTTSQKYSSFGLLNQIQNIPRGKGLGGSGQINFLLHGFGFSKDFQRWARLGFKGWTEEDLKPYFKKAFGTTISEFDSVNCSMGGECPGKQAPMKLKLVDARNELMTIFQEASSQSNYNNTVVFRKATATLKDGMRFSSLDAYLKPALKRRNLHVLLKTQAIFIRFENKTASSVYILQNHRDLDNIFVNKEVILCAGAIKTPQLLILSGVGPKNDIKRLNLPLVFASPHVGQNLHDHMNVPLFVSVEKPVSITLAKIFTFGTVWDYYWNSEGYLSFPPVAGVEYQNRSALMLFSMGTASDRLLRDLSNYKLMVFRDTFPFHNDTAREGFMFLATCVQPTSRGSVSVSVPNTSFPPVVDANYLHDHGDVKCIIKVGYTRVIRSDQNQCAEQAERGYPAIYSTEDSWNVPPVWDPVIHLTKANPTHHTARPCDTVSSFCVNRIVSNDDDEAIRRAEKLLSTQPFKDIAARMHWPRPERCRTFWRYSSEDQIGTRRRKRKFISEPEVQTPLENKQTPSPPDQFLECVIREVGVTGHHVAGTCAGGKVVDSMLRVKGVSGVRIMDASILPSPISLYPNSVLIAMAERAAAIITRNI